MYLMEFVNSVRVAQGYGGLDRLPAPDRDGSPLERAMGCRLEGETMRLASPASAEAVSAALGLPLSLDHSAVRAPAELRN
ncbi:MAG TPA: hypothetical protein VKA36_01005 [Solirubrobacterales bacterium]|nr:hypothetical protein [Solirubrobacterales bacterium]